MCCQRDPLLPQLPISLALPGSGAHAPLTASFKKIPRLPSSTSLPWVLAAVRAELPHIEHWVQTQGFFPGICSHPQRTYGTVAYSPSLHPLPLT